MNVVLDTNVIVAGLLSPYGPRGEIIRLVAEGVLHLSFDARLLGEYEEVLLRPKFHFDAGKVRAFLDQVEEEGLLATAGPLVGRLPDPDDEPFLEVAFGAKVECLVTGNARHFPEDQCHGVRVLSPAEFLDFYREVGPR